MQSVAVWNRTICNSNPCVAEDGHFFSSLAPGVFVIRLILPGSKTACRSTDTFVMQSRLANLTFLFISKDCAQSI